MATVTRAQALESLLGELFSAEQLRRFLVGLAGGEAVVQELPAGPVSLAELAHQAAAELQRAGRVNPALFAALREARPGQGAAIDAVAACWAEQTPSASDRAEGAPWEPAAGARQTIINHGPVGRQINVAGDAVLYFGKDDA